MIIWVFLNLQFAFEVGILSIFGRLDDGNYMEELKENYGIVNKGYNSFPANLPGTKYRKAILVRNFFFQLLLI